MRVEIVASEIVVILDHGSRVARAISQEWL